MLIVRNSLDNLHKLVKDFEAKSGFVLPRNYKNFLLKYNGGQTPKTSFYHQDIGYDLRYFCGLGEKVPTNEQVRVSVVVDKKYIIFAEDSYGNQYAFSAGKIKDSVYFLNHEKENIVEVIAESFLDFIEHCVSQPVEEAARRTPEQREIIMKQNGKGDRITDALRQMWKAEYEKNKDIIQEEVNL